MYLANIKLWNFRKYGNINSTAIDLSKPDLNLDFNAGINVLIGENDSGKTAIIDAIRIVLKTQDYEWYRVKSEDFFKNSKRFRIELRFEKLTNNEAKNFIEWLSFKKIEGKDEKEFFLRLIYDVERTDSRIFASDVCAGSDDKGYPLTAEARDFLRVTYLKPLRDAENELASGRFSRLSSILFSSAVFKNGEQTTELETKIKDFNNFVESFFSDTEKEGHKIKEILDEYLAKFIDNNAEASFKFSTTDVKSILAKLDLAIKDVVNPGLGSLNRLYMAAELLNLKRDNWDGVRLGLIEELEAHLHPQAQLKVIESLIDSCSKNNIQFILTTHSPNLASKMDLENLILCSNNNCYPLGVEYTNLDKNDYIFLQKFLDVTKCNLFFAKGLIFVEGWAEQIILPSLVEFLKEKKIISKTLTEAGVSIINVGNTAFLRYAKIFQRKDLSEIGIPIAIITDSDVAMYDKDSLEPISSKDIETKLKSVIAAKEKEYTYGNTIKAYVAKDWTLEYALYKSNIFSSNFQSIAEMIHPRSFSNGFEKGLAEKLLHQKLYKTEIAYELVNSFASKDFDTFSKEEIENDESISYLVEAIKFVCI